MLHDDEKITVMAQKIIFFSDPFLSQCARWLKKDSEERSVALADYELFLPYARLIPFLHQELLKETQGRCILPTIKTFKAPFGYEHSVHSQALPLSDLSFQGRFLKEVKKYLGPEASLRQAQHLAHSLLQVSLDVAAHRGKFEDLDSLVPEKLSQHFQKTYSFLKKFAFLPLMRQYIQRFHQFQEKQRWWSQHPVTHPVVALGFCPFFAYEKQDLEGILRLPQGVVIFHQESFNIKDKQSSSQTFSLAFLRDKGLADFSPSVCPNLTLPDLYVLEAQNLEEESFNIAVLMYQTKGKALLICKIPEIYERVVQHLRYLGASSLPEIPQRYQDHPLGVFLQLLLDVVKAGFSAPSLLALAQSPMINQVPLHAKAAEKIKDFLLKNHVVQPFSELVHDPKMRVISAIWRTLHLFFEPLVALSKKHELQPLKEWIKVHFDLAQCFKPHLFTVETQEMGIFFKECVLASSDYPLLSFQDYTELLQSFLQSQCLRLEPKIFSDQKYFIQDMETGRLISANRVIIAGLNEGMVPFFKRANPWVNNAMKQKLNLPMESDEIARQTELFMENIKGDQVFLTRCLKINSEMALPSRFWTYMQTYANPLLYPALPVHSLQGHAMPRFSPCIFLSRQIWPSFFTVSDLQLLFQNPYAFYIKKVLQLKTLSFPQNKKTPLEKGLLLHALLEDWARTLSKQFPKNPPVSDQISRNLLNELSLKWGHHYGFTEKQELSAQLDFFHLQNSNLHPEPIQIFVEKAGKIKTKIGERSVVFYAKADRIDLLSDESVRIIDYKTGQLPTLKALKEGESVQLIMESFLAMNQAFIPSVNFVESVQAWQLKNPASKSQIVVLSQNLDLISRSIMDTFSLYFEGKVPLKCLKIDFDMDLVSRVFEEDLTRKEGGVESLNKK